MIFSNWMKAGDFIGVTAPSDGNNKEIDFIRLNNAATALGKNGYFVTETPNVRSSLKGRSSNADIRAKQLESLLEDERVSFLVSAGGGDFLCEMLSFLDFDKIRNHPKWIQGYSDNTGLLFTVTTLCDIATIYGNHFKDFGMEPWHPSMEQNIEILKGNFICQDSFEQYENGFYDRITGLEGYVLTEPVNWRNAGGESEITMEGRILGGCLDVLQNLCGTRFDKTREYVERYREDGILWYLESFDLNSEAMVRGLWQLKEAGWFRYAKGFFFGRPCMFTSNTDTSYEEAVMTVLRELDLPIILDGDVGHKAPRFTFVNGAIGRIHSAGGKGSLNMWSKP